MGDSVATSIAIPSQASPGNSYSGSILRPADTEAYPGKRPVAALAHGRGGNRCALFWAAQTLAGHGYIAMVWSAPGPSTQIQFVRGADAQKSAVAFARSEANPYASRTDGNRVALVGYSLGAGVTSLNQEAEDPGIRAAVFFDNLRRYRSGDPGGVDYDCGLPPTNEVTPRVPSIGFAKDEPCEGQPASPPNLKQAGFRHWRSRDISAMQIVMRGFDHGDFGNGGAEAGWHDLSHYALAWLDRWVLGKRGASKRLLAETVNGRRATQVFSSTFTSGVFLPGLLNSSDLGRLLTRDAGAPDTTKLSRPRSTTTSRALRRHPLRYRFKSDQAASTFVSPGRKEVEAMRLAVGDRNRARRPARPPRARDRSRWPAGEEARQVGLPGSAGRILSPGRRSPVKEGRSMTMGAKHLQRVCAGGVVPQLPDDRCHFLG